MFPEQQISILERFLKVHVTRKTGINYILKYITTEKYVRLELLSNIKKNLPTPNFSTLVYSVYTCIANCIIRDSYLFLIL